MLWPSLTLTSCGGYEDKNGIDAYDNGKSIQIKYDRMIAETRNIYHEFYEKTKGKPDQEWRPSPHQAQIYIFVTQGFAVRISIDYLARAERDLRLILINETSMGFLIPLLRLTDCEIKSYEDVLVFVQ